MMIAEDYLKLVSDWEDPNPAPVLSEHDGVVVVRDDLLEGGSKIRFIDKLIKDTPCDEWVFGGSNKVGWGPISLAYVCKKYKKKTTCFWANRKEPTWHQKEYMKYDGIIEWVKMGMLNVTLSRAEKYRKESPDTRRTLPLGLEHEWVLGSIIKVARQLNIKPDVVWTVGSSGTLNRGLQLAFENAECHVIQTGHKMNERQIGRAKLWETKYKYDKPVKEKEAPPFPSAPEYDGKAWKIIQENMDKNKVNLFWNVAK
tara:strand:+ start:404 stop:1171 length:768 start_codon:yes stop_codon:yes gene_type:complete